MREIKKILQKYIQTFQNQTENIRILVSNNNAFIFNKHPTTTDINNHKQPSKKQQLWSSTTMRMMMPPPPTRMRHFLLLSTTVLTFILVMNSGSNVNVNGHGQSTVDKAYGQGGYRLVNGKIRLSNNAGSDFFQGCTFTKVPGYFIVHYDMKAAKKGCAVDFITYENMANQIKFTASVMDPNSKGLAQSDCLTTCKQYQEEVATNDNSIPFIFSQSNLEIARSYSGPEYEYSKPNGSNCNKNCSTGSVEAKCIKSTALEMRWSRCGDSGISAYLHAVGEPLLSGFTRTTERGGIEATMDIDGRATTNTNGDEASYTYDNKLFERDPALLACLSKNRKEIPIPKAWPIDESDHHHLETKEKNPYLFVFNLLPQGATRKFITAQNKSKISNKPLTGIPKCSLSIKFPTAYYPYILYSGNSIPTTTMATTTTTKAMILPSTTMNKTSVANKNSTKSSQLQQPAEVLKKNTGFSIATTTTIMTETEIDQKTDEEEPAMEEEDTNSKTEKDTDEENNITIGVIAAVTFITIILIITIVIICICRRKKKTKARKTIGIGGQYFFGTHGATLVRRRDEGDEFYLTRQTLSNDAQKGGNGTRETIWEWNDTKEDDEAIYKDMDLHPEDYWEDAPIPIPIDDQYFDDEMEDEFSEDG